MNTFVDRELDWDDQIEKESEFVLLPAGDYEFTVTGFKRARHSGSAKLSACNKAELDIEITSPEGTAVIRHNLFLHTKTEGILSAFFVSIGQKKHGEALKMNWNKVVGSKGRCKVIVDTWTGKDGQEKQSNKIAKFYEPTNNSEVKTTPSFQAGKF